MRLNDHGRAGISANVSPGVPRWAGVNERLLIDSIGPCAGLSFGAFLAVAAWWRRRVGLRRQREFDAGARCLRCDGTTMQVAGDQATCLDCRYSVSLAKLRANAITEKDLV